MDGIKLFWHSYKKKSQSKLSKFFFSFNINTMNKIDCQLEK